MTEFETSWYNAAGYCSLRQRRAQHYDPLNSMYYCRNDFYTTPIEVAFPEPSTPEVQTAFIEFVRGEFGDMKPGGVLYPGTPVFSEARATGREPFEYLSYCEKTLVYGPYLEKLLGEAPQDPALQMYAVFADGQLGNKRNKVNCNIDAFVARVQPALAEKKRIMFVLPAFPFKDQNPFRTDNPPEVCDFAELALLIRLHTLSLACFQIHGYGVDWILLCDGTAYSEMFGVPTSAAMQYKNALIEWRDRLNLQGHINILDLGEVVARLNIRREANGAHYSFFDVCEGIKQQLVELGESGDPEFLSKWKALERGMTWNLDLRRYTGKLTREQLWNIVKDGYDNSPESHVRLIAEEIQQRAKRAAIEYAAFNLALRMVNAIPAVLPDTIRATIHAKKDQIAVPSLGSVFPWNGVAVLDNSRNTYDLKIEPVMNLAKEEGVRRATLLGSEGFFYYCH